MAGGMFALIDATGGGACRLRADDTIVDASEHFIMLTGATLPIAGRSLHEVLPELPPLAELPPHVETSTPVLRQVGGDGLGRELSAATLELDGQRFVVLVDRSGEASLRRAEARLGRQIDDLKAELAAREREPRKPRVRTMIELARRLDEALMRARRYQHGVTILAIRLASASSDDAVQVSKIGETILASIRGVDDLGRIDDFWVLVLPHTGLEGGEVVARRVQIRLGALGLGAVAIGCAQVGVDEAGSKTVERAEQACLQALEKGGGVLLAVALV